MVKAIVSKENFMAIILDSFDEILDICEEKEEEGWKIVAILPIYQIEWGSFLKLTNLQIELFLLFRKKR